MKALTWKQAGAVVLVILGLILAFAPFEPPTSHNLHSESVARTILEREDHITAEQLGQMIIDKDPGYLLIDLRDSESYAKYHIPTAINIPLETLFADSILTRLSRDRLIVLCSNGGTHAGQAWVLLQQLGFKNSLVLLGGLNYWVEVYSNPSPPEGVYADSEIFRYQYLISAGKALVGDGTPSDGQQVDPAADMPKIQLPVMKKKKRADEGC